MYQVIEMYGDSEPWWFFDGWRRDIVSELQFKTFGSALRYYEKRIIYLKSIHELYKEQPRFLAAFWNEIDERWCADCDEYLQQYHGVALLKNYQIVPKYTKELSIKETTIMRSFKCCKLNGDQFS
ncbi:MAG: DUF1033 family protein [Streptococcaceae bacterium]|jgi:hypothetical protein|nr:DUF1033 family protein [Streptococcaceae bacterium]